jgi:hypothetical protein
MERLSEVGERRKFLELSRTFPLLQHFPSMFSPGARKDLVIGKTAKGYRVLLDPVCHVDDQPDAGEKAECLVNLVIHRGAHDSWTTFYLPTKTGNRWSESLTISHFNSQSRYDKSSTSLDCTVKFMRH